MRLLAAVLMAGVLLLQANAGSLAAEPKVITMIAETRETHLQFQEEMAAAFVEQHPDVRIELVSTAGTGLVAKMQTMIAGGTPPDIGYMDPYLLVEWGRAGILENLSPYIEQETQYRDWYQTAFKLYEADGKVYGIPQDLQIGAIFYNKTHYAAAGLAFPEPGWTYGDLRENARRLTAKDSSGTATRYGFRIPTGRNWLLPLWAFGGDLLDDWNQPTRFTGNDPRVIDGFEYLRSLVELEAVQDEATFRATATEAAFINQQVSMLLTNTIVLAHFGQIQDFEWDVVPLPHGPAGAVPYVNAIGWMMFSTAEHKPETWALLRFMTTPEALARRVEIVGNVPPSQSLILNEWIPSRQAPEGRTLLFDDLESARSPWSLSNRIFDPMNREWLELVWGRKPIPSAIATMEEQVTALLAEEAARN